jgi:hypothetical protein
MKNEKQLSMIHFGIRQSFDNIEEIEDRYTIKNSKTPYAILYLNCTLY